METNAQPNLSSLEKLAEQLAHSEAPYKPAQAFQLFTEGQYARALALCNQVKSESETPPISADLISARCHLALARFAEAAESFHQALTIDPENPVALKGLGDVHFARGSTEVALSYYERVAELCPDSVVLSQDLIVPECRAFRDRYQRNHPPGDPGERNEERSEREPESNTLPNLPTIEVTETQTESDSESPTPDTKPEKTSAQPPQSVTLKRHAEPGEESRKTAPTPSAPSQSALNRVPNDFPRYDRLNFPDHYQTETMADLLIRQGHHRAAMDILRTLVKQDARPGLVEKLKTAEEMAGKRGR